MTPLPSRREEVLSAFPVLRSRMNRLLEDFFGRDWGVDPLFADVQGWAPVLDVAETQDAVVVQAEVPGVDPKDVEVTLTGGVLTIKGERREEKEEKGKTYHRVERSRGSFVRSVAVPGGADITRVRAVFENGVLTVTLPKKEEAKAKSITVEVKAM